LREVFESGDDSIFACSDGFVLILFGHIARVNIVWKKVSWLHGVMSETNVRGRPFREWLDDVKKLCNIDI